MPWGDAKTDPSAGLRACATLRGPRPGQGCEPRTTGSAAPTGSRVRGGAPAPGLGGMEGEACARGSPAPFAHARAYLQAASAALREAGSAQPGPGDVAPPTEAACLAAAALEFSRAGKKGEGAGERAERGAECRRAREGRGERVAGLPSARTGDPGCSLASLGNPVPYPAFLSHCPDSGEPMFLQF